MASIIRAFFNRFGAGRRFVGRDLEGNKFYELPPAQPDSSRTKRRVKYKKSSDMYAYASGISRLPAQWTAWMAHTRQHPPTLEELQTDMNRQLRVKALAADLAAKDAEERQRQLASVSSTASLQAPLEDQASSDQPAGPFIGQKRPAEVRTGGEAGAPSDKLSQNVNADEAELRAEAQRRTRAKEPAELRKAVKSDDGPQGWNPTTVRRR